MAMKARCIVLMNGPTGSGKSYCAERLGDALDGSVLVRTAQIRREMGLAEAGQPTPHAHFAEDSQPREAVYDEIGRRLIDLIESGRRIVLDGAYETEAKRSIVYHVAAKFDVPVFCVFCHCPRPVALERIAQRRGGTAVTQEADSPQVLQHIESVFEYPFADASSMKGPLAVFDLNTDKSIAQVVGKVDTASTRELKRAIEKSGYYFQVQRRQRVGLDFDGLIADTSAAKQDYAADRFGISLRRDQCLRERGSEILGAEAYRKMIDDIYGTDLTMALTAMNGAGEAMARLDSFCDCYIITARHADEFKWMTQWITEHELPVHGISHTCEQSKRHVAEALRLDWFFDDSIRNLTDMGDLSTHPVLYDPTELHTAPPADGIARVSTWDDIVELVKSGC